MFNHLISVLNLIRVGFQKKKFKREELNKLRNTSEIYPVRIGSPKDALTDLAINQAKIIKIIYRVKTITKDHLHIMLLQHFLTANKHQTRMKFNVKILLQQIRITWEWALRLISLTIISQIKIPIIVWISILQWEVIIPKLMIINKHHILMILINLMHTLINRHSILQMRITSKKLCKKLNFR